MSELLLSTTSDGISWHAYLCHYGEKTIGHLEVSNMTKTGETGNKYWNKSYYYQVTDMAKDASFYANGGLLYV